MIDNASSYYMSYLIQCGGVIDNLLTCQVNDHINN